MAERKAITKKTRFEVFKRDSFTCQYCGKSAPNVILEIDHINPVSNGGKNGIMNLITSCFDCNRGKGKRELTDKQVITQQQEQLKVINEKREQLKMLLQWKEEISKLTDEEVAAVVKILDYSEIYLTDNGIGDLKKWIRKYGISEVIDSCNISIEQYYSNDSKSKEKVFSYIPRICYRRLQQKEKPYTKEIYYILNIATDKFRCNKYSLQSLLFTYIHSLEEAEEVKRIYHDCRYYDDFVDAIKLNYEER